MQHVDIGLNSVSPLRIISEATQLLMLTPRYRVRGQEVAATLGIQRVLDFVIAALLLGVGLMFLPRLKGFTPYVISAILIAVISVLAVQVVIWFGSRPGLTQLRILATTSSSLKELTRAWVKLAWSFSLTLGDSILLGLSAWVLAYGMEIDNSPLVATLLVIGTLTFAALVPSLPASVGTFEFAVFYLLTTIGVGDDDALGFALMILAILFMPPIIIAIMVFTTWAVTGEGKPTQLAPDWLRTTPRRLQPLSIEPFPTRCFRPTAHRVPSWNGLRPAL